MKKLFLIIALVSIAANTYAATPQKRSSNRSQQSGVGPVSEGQWQMNAGVGFSNWGVPLYIGFDYGVHPDITLGGEFAYRSWSENWKGNYYDHSIYGLSFNGNYHFNRVMGIPRNWDFYAGLNIGYEFWNDRYANGLPVYQGTYNSGLGLGAQVGGRYYFNDKVGINLEFGGGNASNGGKFGISIRF